jgi:endonuclease/exonuclease/phosphatase family metal-dependent hydrolase
MDRLHVATLNIRNLADRWDERLPLILADMAALQPDILGLQEVVYRPVTNRRAAGPADPSTATRCSSGSRSLPPRPSASTSG